MMIEKWKGLMRILSDKNNNKICIKIVNAYIHAQGKTCRIQSQFGLMEYWGIDNMRENWEGGGGRSVWLGSKKG